MDENSFNRIEFVTSNILHNDFFYFKDIKAIENISFSDTIQEKIDETQKENKILDGLMKKNVKENIAMNEVSRCKLQMIGDNDKRKRNTYDENKSVKSKPIKQNEDKTHQPESSLSNQNKNKLTELTKGFNKSFPCSITQNDLRINKEDNSTQKPNNLEKIAKINQQREKRSLSNQSKIKECKIFKSNINSAISKYNNDNNDQTKNHSIFNDDQSAIDNNDNIQQSQNSIIGQLDLSAVNQDSFNRILSDVSMVIDNENQVGIQNYQQKEIVNQKRQLINGIKNNHQFKSINLRLDKKVLSFNFNYVDQKLDVNIVITIYNCQAQEALKNSQKVFNIEDFLESVFSEENYDGFIQKQTEFESLNMEVNIDANKEVDFCCKCKKDNAEIVQQMISVDDKAFPNQIIKLSKCGHKICFQCTENQLPICPECNIENI